MLLAVLVGRLNSSYLKSPNTEVQFKFFGSKHNNYFSDNYDSNEDVKY